jgi:hypothetical protein
MWPLPRSPVSHCRPHVPCICEGVNITQIQGTWGLQWDTLITLPRSCCVYDTLGPVEENWRVIDCDDEGWHTIVSSLVELAFIFLLQEHTAPTSVSTGSHAMTWEELCGRG